MEKEYLVPRELIWWKTSESSHGGGNRRGWIREISERGKRKQAKDASREEDLSSRRSTSLFIQLFDFTLSTWGGREGEPALIIRESRDKPPVVTTLPLVFFFFFYSIFIFSFLFAFLVLVERVLVIFWTVFDLIKRGILRWMDAGEWGIRCFILNGGGTNFFSFFFVSTSFSPSRFILFHRPFNLFDFLTNRLLFNFL